LLPLSLKKCCSNDVILPLRLGLGALLFTFSLPPFLLVKLLRLLLSLL